MRLHQKLEFLGLWAVLLRSSPLGRFLVCVASSHWPRVYRMAPRLKVNLHRSANMATQYRLVTDREGFAALRTHWNELVSKCEVDHAFMQHEWFECWINAFHKTGLLAVQTAWRNDQLVGAAPMRIVREKARAYHSKFYSSFSPG